MKKFLAVLLTLLILVLFPVILLVTITRYWLLTPQTFKQIIWTSTVAENLPSIIVSLLEQDQPTNEVGELGIDLTGTAEAVAGTVSPEEIYTITDSLIDGVSTWWGTTQPIEQLEVMISVTNLKSKISSAITEQLKQSGMTIPCDPTIPVEIDCATDPS